MRKDNNYMVIVPIAALAFVLYLPAMRGGFSWDEFNLYFGSSPFMAFEEFGYSRPLYMSMLLLLRSLFGDNALAYHIVSSLLHALNSIMVFFVAMRLFKDRRVSIISALLFALHPVNSEAVSWIYAGSDLLKTFLVLISLHLYLMYREDRMTPALLASTLFYLLACLAGQSALVLPVALLLYEGLLGEGVLRERNAIIAYLVAIVLYIAAFGGEGEILSFARSQEMNINGAVSALGYYSLKLALPVGLSLMPPLQAAPYYPIVALSMLVLPFMFRGKFKAESYLLFFVLIMLIPALFVALAGSSNPLGARYMYTPSIGFSMLMALLISRAGNKRAMIALASVLAVLYAAGSFDRALVWGDRTELWREAVRKNDVSAMHRINLAATLILSDRSDEAKLPLRIALQSPRISSAEFKRVMEMLYEISPGSDDEMFELLSEAKGPAKAYLGMGFYYFDLYSKDEARDNVMLEKAIKYLLSAVEENQSLVMARYYLGLGYLETGEYDKSIDQLMAVNSMDYAGKYSSDTEYYLGLARKMKAISGMQLGKSPAKEFKIDLK